VKTLSPELIELVAKRFWVLSEPTRLSILNALLAGERTVTELVEETGLGQANVSRHLQVLRTARFVDRRKEGLFSFYCVADPSVSQLCDIMCRRLGEQAEENRLVVGNT
jgi:DNA-binding transcriptional ArsR family regulator